MKKMLQKSFALLVLISTLSLASCKPNETTNSSENVSSNSDIPTISEPSSEDSSSLIPVEKEEWWDDEVFRDPNKNHYVPVSDVVLEDGDFHTETQKAYITSSWNYYFKYSGVNGGEELSKPRGVKINLNSINDLYVELSTNKDLSDSFIYKLDGSDKPFVKNLLGGTKYYYRTSSNKDNFTSPINEITTSNLYPRNLDIDGVTNVRDLGGYTSKLGGTIKQNMIIRGARLNENETSEPVKLITQEGYETLTKTIGVKTEIDLRSGAEEAGHMNNDVFPEIEYHLVPMNTRRVDNIMLEFKPQIKEVFDMFADINNYPIYYHCKIGTDRTGLISYLLGALLGMNQDDLLTDYLFSNFGHIGSQRQEWDLEEDYYDVLRETYKKPTLQLCVEAFLLEIGVSAENIQTIKDIMLVK